MPAGQIRLEVSGIRGPPTTSAVSGFAISTVIVSTDSEDGNAVEVIDESSNTPLTLKVDQAEPVISSNMVVSADLQSIFTESTLTFKVMTDNPLDPGSNIQFTLPSEFDISNVDSVSVKTINADEMEPFSFCGQQQSGSSESRCVEWNEA